MQIEIQSPPPDESARNAALRAGFTLIELSIVLVIIGLVVGGVLVGRDLIEAARIRATISQIEKYQTAANTFRGKYGYLPGDIPDPAASHFGFAHRGAYEGEGDGNGALEGIFANAAGLNRMCFEAGELAMFWVDLSAAKMIDVGFTYAASDTGFTASVITATTTPSIGTFMPEAKLGQGNYIYVYDSIVPGAQWTPQGVNSFGLSTVTNLSGNGSILPTTILSVSVRQAYAIDSKIDDGLPQTGNVTSQFVGGNTVYWASGTTAASIYGANPGTSATASTTTCFDNGGSVSTPMQYSLSQNNGAGANCALSFRFQ